MHVWAITGRNSSEQLLENVCIGLVMAKQWDCSWYYN